MGKWRIQPLIQSTQSTNSTNHFPNSKTFPTFAFPERRYIGNMIIINVKDGESLDKALKRFKKKFEKTGVLRELRSRQAFEKKSVTRRHVVKHAIYKQGLNAETSA
jgi:small subunit ribosomal protein S21